MKVASLVGNICLLINKLPKLETQFIKKAIDLRKMGGV